MSSTPALPPDTEEEQQRALIYEQFIANVLKLRQVEQPKKSAWQIFIESSGGAALITVVLGASLGAWVTASYQSRQADIDRQRSQQQKIQELRLDAMVNASTFIWTSVAASDDLLQLSTEAFADAPTDQRNEIRAKYIEADSKWRSASKGELSFKINYYYRDSPDFIKTWPLARDSVSKYVDCAGGWIEKHPRYTKDLGGGCIVERETMEQNLQTLEASITKL